MGKVVHVFGCMGVHGRVKGWQPHRESFEPEVGAPADVHGPVQSFVSEGYLVTLALFVIDMDDGRWIAYVCYDLVLSMASRSLRLLAQMTNS